MLLFSTQSISAPTLKVKISDLGLWTSSNSAETSDTQRDSCDKVKPRAQLLNDGVKTAKVGQGQVKVVPANGERGRFHDERRRQEELKHSSRMPKARKFFVPKF